MLTANDRHLIQVAMGRSKDFASMDARVPNHDEYSILMQRLTSKIDKANLTALKSLKVRD